MKFPFVNSASILHILQLLLVTWQAELFFLCHQRIQLSLHKDFLFCYYVWINSLFSFMSPNLSHERLLSLPLLTFLLSNIWMIHWSDPWGYSMTLISFVQYNRIFPLYSDVSLDILHLKFTLPFLLLVCFSCLSLCFSFLSYVLEVDILYFVAGWAYASRHTILLGIGTATSIWCQSKYYSLFTDIMSNGHSAAHDEAYLYVYLV